jgi:hypothetical protein
VRAAGETSGEPSAVSPAESIAIGSEAWRNLPAAQRAAQILVMQASAGPEFALSATSAGGLSAWQPEMALRTTFERGRVTVLADSADGAPSKPIELAASAWGCEGAMQEVEGAAPRSSAERSGVSYAHPDFDEWYTLGPAGLEQGFTIRRLPECVKRGQPLRVQLRFSAVEGSIAQLDATGNDAVLTAPGHRSLHYSDPFARDAAGVEHPARITAGDALAVEVDVTDATLPLTVDPLVWDIQQKLLPNIFKPPSFAPSDFFGQVIAVSGDTAVIGAPGDRQKGLDAGAVYVFARLPKTPGVASRWSPQQKLSADDGATADSFGASVAVSGDTLLVGAPGDDDRGSASGAVYVFVRSGSTWTVQQKLVPSDLSAGSQLGSSVALAGDTAIMGAPLQSGSALAEVGAAYAFARAGTIWSQQKKFGPPSASAGLHFGATVATTGGTVAIGRDNLSAGGVDWFTKLGSAWNVSGTSFTSSNPHFGSALAMTDTVTVIGARGEGNDPGLVSVTKTISPHTLLATLIASDGKPGDQFGYAVAVSDNTIVVGAPSVDTAPGNVKCNFIPDSGAAYVFSNGSSWTQQQKLGAYGLLEETVPGLGTVCDPGERLGAAVATAGTFVLMGAPARSDAGWLLGFPNEGAVFHNEYALTNASPCTQNSECFSGYCVEGVCCQSACEGACRSCLADLKDPAHSFNGDWVTGLCGEVREDTDPKNGCSNAGTTCGTLDVCSASGSCKAANPPGTPCGGAGTFCATATSAAGKGVCANYSCNAIAFSCDRGYLCKAGVCKTSCSSKNDCDAAKGYTCKEGLCKLGTGVNCTADGDCASGLCQVGVCSEPPPNCDAGGDACGSAGAAGEGGQAGEAGAAGAAGQAGEAGASGEHAGGAPSEAGSAGEAADAGDAGTRALGGAGGSLASGGSAGKNSDLVECSPTCAAGLFCNRHTGECQDKLVTACGCRVAGGRGTPGTHLALLAAGAILWAGRRRQKPWRNRPRS